MMSMVERWIRAKPVPPRNPAVTYRIQMGGVSKYATASPDSRNPDILSPMPNEIAALDISIS